MLEGERARPPKVGERARELAFAALDQIGADTTAEWIPGLSQMLKAEMSDPIEMREPWGVSSKEFAD